MTTPVVTTTHGPVRGLAVEGGCEFRGIPYAAPIGGERRFRAAVPPQRWRSVRDATSWPAMTPQPPYDSAAPEDADFDTTLFGLPYVKESTEDGLYVNVWTPAPDERGRPVMVWLHGGGFWFGQATRPRENGRLLSVLEDVVVVAPSHRLGPAGYLDTRTTIGGDANVGLRDLVLGLEWVRDNVAAFGGDPDNVTVFGESGGSLKAQSLLAMPSAQGLLHKAICQSGVFPHAHLPGGIDPARSARILDAVAASAGGHPELRSASADALSTVRLPAGETWQPVLDGEVLPRTVPEALAKGFAPDVPVLLGTDRDEARVLARWYGLPTTGEQLATLLGHPELATAYADGASDGSPALRSAAERAVTDAWMRIPTVRMAEDRARAASAPAYLYELHWHDPRRPDVGAGHGLETSLLFGNVEDVPLLRDAAGSREMASVMRRAWASFARSGRPELPDAEWPAYVEDGRATALLDLPTRVEGDPDGEWRRLWDEHLPRAARATDRAGRVGGVGIASP